MELHGHQFRSSFSFPENAKGLNWFPGHMLKTTREIQNRLSNVDFVVEVRDARVPFSSRNDQLEQEIRTRQKRRLIVFNKSDLAHPSTPQIVSKALPNDIAIFTSAKNGFNIKNIINTCLTKYTVAKKFKTIPYVFLIAGIPNVGKSSIINSLKNKYAKTFDNDQVKNKAKVGALPGVTRSINFFKVCEKPHPCVVLDSPGIFIPTINSDDQALKLGLINALPDSLAFDQITLSDYLLFELNRLQCFEYVTVFKLPHPSDSIQWVLEGICRTLNAYITNAQPDIQKASVIFLRYFRQGKLGRVTLEDHVTVQSTMQ
jgi:ribosome biogenesis GTPase A